jgi:hypothetical protein
MAGVQDAQGNEAFYKAEESQTINRLSQAKDLYIVL